MIDIVQPTPEEILKILTDADMLEVMHQVVERKDFTKKFNHGLVEALGAHAFGSDDIPAVSLGARLQEVASDFIPHEDGTTVVHLPDDLLTCTPEEARDIFLDVIPGFANVTRIHAVVTAAGEEYYYSPRNRGHLLAGAALSHALMLGRRHSTAA